MAPDAGTIVFSLWMGYERGNPPPFKQGLIRILDRQDLAIAGHVWHQTMEQFSLAASLWTGYGHIQPGCQGSLQEFESVRGENAVWSELLSVKSDTLC